MNVTISLTKKKDLKQFAKVVNESFDETEGMKENCHIVLTFNLPNCNEVQVEK